MKTILILLVLGAIFVASIGMNNTILAAAQLYTGGYPTTSTITIHNQYTMDSAFSGVTTTPTQNLIQVFSTAGFASTSATDPTGWIYQDGVELSTNNEVYGLQQVYYTNTCEWHCPTSPALDIGHYGSGTTDINFVYHTFVWKSDKSGVNFYYERHQNNGGIVSYPFVVYPKNTSPVDTSNYFATGTKTVSSVPVKFFQFGIESPSALTSAWFAKEYTMTYQGTSSYDTQATATTDSNGNSVTGSWITYVSGPTFYPVGTSTYTQVNAHSKHIDGTFLSGTVQWYESGTHVTAGTALWP